jgi:uncharacterized protein (TIGR02246 family)
MNMQAAYRHLPADIEDNSAIAAVISGLERAWAAGNGQKWASYFAEDAYFTAWFGLYLRGGEAIADVHQEIFGSFYKSTELRLDVRDVRFLRADVAVVHLDGRVVGPGEHSPEQPQFVPVAVMTKEKGCWRVAVFHNTKNSVDEHLDNGDVRKQSRN